MLRRIVIPLLVVAAMALAITVSAQNNGPPGGPIGSVPLPVDGSWNTFSWNNLGEIAVPDFQFTGPAVLDVTDCFLDGDQFNIYDNAVLIGTTSVPTDTGQSESDPDTCFANPDYSSVRINLGGGAHDIEMEVIATASGFPSGAAYIRASISAPTLPQWAMVVMLLLVLTVGSLALRRRFTAHTS